MRVYLWRRKNEGIYYTHTAVYDPLDARNERRWYPPTFPVKLGLWAFLDASHAGSTAVMHYPKNEQWMKGV